MLSEAVSSPLSGAPDGGDPALPPRAAHPRGHPRARRRARLPRAASAAPVRGRARLRGPPGGARRGLPGLSRRGGAAARRRPARGALGGRLLHHRAALGGSGGPHRALARDPRRRHGARRGARAPDRAARRGALRPPAARHPRKDARGALRLAPGSDGSPGQASRGAARAAPLQISRADGSCVWVGAATTGIRPWIRRAPRSSSPSASAGGFGGVAVFARGTRVIAHRVVARSRQGRARAHDQGRRERRLTRRSRARKPARVVRANPGPRPEARQADWMAFASGRRAVARTLRISALLARLNPRLPRRGARILRARGRRRSRHEARRRRSPPKKLVRLRYGGRGLRGGAAVPRRTIACAMRAAAGDHCRASPWRQPERPRASPRARGPRGAERRARRRVRGAGRAGPLPAAARAARDRCALRQRSDRGRSLHRRGRSGGPRLRDPARPAARDRSRDRRAPRRGAGRRRREGQAAGIAPALGRRREHARAGASLRGPHAARRAAARRPRPPRARLRADPAAGAPDPDAPDDAQPRQLPRIALQARALSRPRSRGGRRDDPPRDGRDAAGRERRARGGDPHRRQGPRPRRRRAFELRARFRSARPGYGPLRGQPGPPDDRGARPLRARRAPAPDLGARRQGAVAGAREARPRHSHARLAASTRRSLPGVRRDVRLPDGSRPADDRDGGRPRLSRQRALGPRPPAGGEDPSADQEAARGGRADRVGREDDHERGNTRASTAAARARASAGRGGRRFRQRPGSQGRALRDRDGDARCGVRLRRAARAPTRRRSPMLFPPTTRPWARARRGASSSRCATCARPSRTASSSAARSPR